VWPNKAVLVHNTTAFKGSRGVTPPTLNPDSRWKWIVSFMLRRFYPGCHWKRGCVDFWTSLDILKRREIFYPDGNRTSFRQAHSVTISQLHCPDCKVWLNMYVEIKSQDPKLLPTSTIFRQTSCHTTPNVTDPKKFLFTSLLQFYAQSLRHSHNSVASDWYLEFLHFLS
jgi:hypothetical protein